MNATVYDPTCERLDTAVKALWLLYRWGMWGYLAEVGLNKREVERDLARFDYEVIVSERGRIRTEEQCFALVRYCPAILAAALEVMKRYAAATSVSRSEYFTHRSLVEQWFADIGPLPEVRVGRPKNSKKESA